MATYSWAKLLGDICSSSDVDDPAAGADIYSDKSMEIQTVLIYPQVDFEGTIFMKLPQGFEIDGKMTRKSHM